MTASPGSAGSLLTQPFVLYIALVKKLSLKIKLRYSQVNHVEAGLLAGPCHNHRPWNERLFTSK